MLLTFRKAKTIMETGTNKIVKDTVLQRIKAEEESAMKKKIAVALCGTLLFAMLPAGCGNAGAQTGVQGEAEQVSDTKSQDESEEQERLSDARDGKPDVGKDAAGDKNTGDSGSEKDDRGNTQGGKSDTETADIGGSDNGASGKSASGSNAGSEVGGNSGDSTGGKNSSSGISSGNGSSDGSAGNTSSDNGSNGSGASGNGSNSGNAGSGNASSDTGNTSGGTSTSQPEHTHSWVEQTTTVTHDATGHYETVVVKDAWDEEIIERRAVCGCGAVFIDDYAWEKHFIDDECIYGYSVRPVVVDIIHHEAETKEVWIEDSPARTETVGTGSYICSTCGVTK